jgi:hypothetical protein
MDLARVGPLPTVIVSVLFGIIFFIFGVIIVLTKVSERRLKLFSIIFWCFLVVQLYATYAVQVHHTPSTLVCEATSYDDDVDNAYPLQIDSAIFVVFLTYFVIPLSLRIATGLSVTLSAFHLLISTAVAHRTPGEILARQVLSLYMWTGSPVIVLLHVDR